MLIGWGGGLYCEIFFPDVFFINFYIFIPNALLFFEMIYFIFIFSSSIFILFCIVTFYLSILI